MSRPRVEVAVPAIALRRAEAAAALGISIETFDRYVRPNLAEVRIGGVVVYPVEALERFVNGDNRVDSVLSR